MIDVATKKPLRILTHAASGPYIRVSFDQVDELRDLLDRHGVRYRVESDWLSYNGGPEMGVVQLARGTDAEAIQAILDGEAPAPE